MHRQLIRLSLGCLALALPVSAPRAVAVGAGALSAVVADTFAQAATPQAIAEYRRKLKEYQEARAAFDAEAGAYWSSITEKRRGRNAKRRERTADYARRLRADAAAGLCRAEAPG